MFGPQPLVQVSAHCFASSREHPLSSGPGGPLPALGPGQGHGRPGLRFPVHSHHRGLRNRQHVGALGASPPAREPASSVPAPRRPGECLAQLGWASMNLGGMCSAALPPAPLPLHPFAPRHSEGTTAPGPRPSPLCCQALPWAPKSSSAATGIVAQPRNVSHLLMQCAWEDRNRPAGRTGLLDRATGHKSVEEPTGTHCPRTTTPPRAGRGGQACSALTWCASQVHWSGDNVHYSLDSQPPGPFDVDAEGKLYVTQELDREAQAEVR